ncbi:MAG: Hsp33 family molecular chaperone HslO [Pseudomonadota bacterium]
MQDILQRFLFEHAPIRGEIVHLDATWRAVLERHDYPPVLRDVLGELMAACALLSATLKFEGAITLQMLGSGPVKLVVVECSAAHTMRATAKWSGELASSALKDLLGDGRCAITLVPEDGKQGYQGVVALEGRSVAQILEHYMMNSEQIETRLHLACDGRRAAGLLLQKLPQRARREADETDDWERVTQLAATVAPRELLALPAREILRRLYHEEDLRVFAPRTVSFLCACSRERVAGMLRMLGQTEVESILQERGAIDVSCEFCNSKYRFDSVDAAQALAAEHLMPPGTTRH